MKSKYVLLLTASFLTIFCNFTFYKKTLAVYPVTLHTFPFLISIVLILLFVINLILNIIIPKPSFLLKPILIFTLIMSSMISYYTDLFGVVFDTNMVMNILSTNLKEALDLISYKLLIYMVFLGFIPAFFIFKIKIKNDSLKNELVSTGKSILLSLTIIFSLFFIFGKNYASFFRENKPLRYYTNPMYFIYSSGKYVSDLTGQKIIAFTQVGTDAIVPATDKNRELIIFVLGETARADRFSLNGYEKETNPLLKNENVASFKKMISCGTSTAVSVPCMFSNLTRKKFTNELFKHGENLLDVLAHTNDIDVLWRDNNSDSKGVAIRAKYENFQIPKNNPICDVECRDEGMLVGLQEYINKSTKKDIFIVLHQMGNHGPAYYKRYPPQFEKFKPVCLTNELDKCTNEEISNSYDNAILYTDYFLSKVIELLKQNAKEFESIMFYVSDHGESLGENGIYLHSIPYLISPIEQRNVASVLWVDDTLRSEMDLNLLQRKTETDASHDNIFHTMLGLMEIQTKSYNRDLDLLADVFLPKTASTQK